MSLNQLKATNLNMHLQFLRTARESVPEQYVFYSKICKLSLKIIHGRCQTLWFYRGSFAFIVIQANLTHKGQGKKILYRRKTNRFFQEHPEQQIQEGFSLPQAKRWRSMKTQSSSIAAIRCAVCSWPWLEKKKRLHMGKIGCQ